MTDYEACVAYCRSNRTMEDVACEHGVTVDKMRKIVNRYGGYMRDPGKLEPLGRLTFDVALEKPQLHDRKALEAMTQRAHDAYRQAGLHYTPTGSPKEINLALELAIKERLCVKCIAKGFAPRSCETIRIWCSKYGSDWAKKHADEIYVSTEA